MCLFWYFFLIVFFGSILDYILRDSGKSAVSRGFIYAKSWKFRQIVLANLLIYVEKWASSKSLEYLCCNHTPKMVGFGISEDLV